MLHVLLHTAVHCQRRWAQVSCRWRQEIEVAHSTEICLCIQGLHSEVMSSHTAVPGSSRWHSWHSHCKWHDFSGVLVVVHPLPRCSLSVAGIQLSLEILGTHKHCKLDVFVATTHLVVYLCTSCITERINDSHLKYLHCWYFIQQ